MKEENKSLCDKVKTLTGWSVTKESKHYCTLKGLTCHNPYEKDCLLKKFELYKISEGNYLK